MKQLSVYNLFAFVYLICSFFSFAFTSSITITVDRMSRKSGMRVKSYYFIFLGFLVIVLKFASKFFKAISIYIHVHDKSAEVLFAYYLTVSKVHLSSKKYLNSS